jgi:hypothetical protein
MRVPDGLSSGVCISNAEDLRKIILETAIRLRILYLLRSALQNRHPGADRSRMKRVWSALRVESDDGQITILYRASMDLASDDSRRDP